MVMRGEVRIPVFQRGLTWTATDVVELFDSIYRGFPIGSLLLHRGPAPAGPLKIGSLETFGMEMQRALWVVDGQQRLTSLVAAMGRNDASADSLDGLNEIYFDAATQRFSSPAEEEEVPATWVAVSKLAHSSALMEWLSTAPHGHDATLRSTVLEARRRLREYRISLYIFDADEESTLQLVFARINRSTGSPSWADIHDALFTRVDGRPSSLRALTEQLSSLGMGKLDEQSQLMPSLVAFCGLDVSRGFDEHLRDQPARFEGIAASAATTLREVLGFLRTRAKIPHLRLLPYSAPLLILARFFKEHPDPNSRTQMLLVRWIWRSLLDPGFDDLLVSREGTACISDDEEESAQRLLSLVGQYGGVGLLTQHDGASLAQARVWLLGLASLRPQHLSLDAARHPGEVNIPTLAEATGERGFRRLFPVESHPHALLATNRILLPGNGPAEEELRTFVSFHGIHHPALGSHAISPACAAALVAGDVGRALEQRSTTLAEALTHFSNGLAEWHRSDRPSIEYLLAQAAGE
jgi:Protein of unknown function DUF262